MAYDPLSLLTPRRLPVSAVDEYAQGLLGYKRTDPLSGLSNIPDVTSASLLQPAQQSRGLMSSLGDALTGEGSSARLQALGAALLSGPSRTPISFGSQLAKGLLAGTQFAEEQKQQRLLNEMKQQDLLRKQQKDATEMAFKQAQEKRAESLFDVTMQQKAKELSDEQNLTQEQAKKEVEALKSTQIKTYNVLNAINEAQDLAEGFFATGLTGQILKEVGGTDARRLDGLLNVIKSNLGFDELKKMRFESPTGGALGQISDKENQLLQSTVDSLDLTQDADQLNKSLDRVKRHYGAVAFGVIDEDGKLKRVETVEDVAKLESGVYKVNYPEQYTSSGSSVIEVTRQDLQAK